MRTITNKQFRALLNKRFPHPDPTERGRYKARARSHGDYLWHQDREQFLFTKAEYEAGRLPHLDE